MKNLGLIARFRSMMILPQLKMILVSLIDIVNYYSNCHCLRFNLSDIWATWLNNTMALVDSAFKLPDRNGSKSSDSIFDLLFITPIQANNRSQEWSNETMVNISNLLPVNLTSFNNLTANFIKDVNKTGLTI